MGEAAAFVAGHPLLRPIFVTAVVFNMAWYILLAIFVAYAVGDLGMTGAQVGLTLGRSGVGMISGATAAPALVRRLRFGAMLATVIGSRACLLAAAIGFFVQLVVIWLSDVRGLRELPEAVSATQPSTLPTPPAASPPRSGPPAC